MKVIATKEGYYQAYREIGDEFEVEQGQEASWFKPVGQVKKGELPDDPHVPAGEPGERYKEDRAEHIKGGKTDKPAPRS